MRTLSALFLVIMTSALPAQAVTRRAGESVADFVRRVGPGAAELAHVPVETDAWRLGSKAIVAFYTHRKDLGDPQGIVPTVRGYVYLPAAGGEYRELFIGDIGPEGAEPVIESVFFANANADPAKELVVIVSWPQAHYDVSGTLYGTFIYELPRRAGAESFDFLEQVSERVSGSCACEWRDGRKARSRFTTAAEVRLGLQRLGFR